MVKECGNCLLVNIAEDTECGNTMILTEILFVTGNKKSPNSTPKETIIVLFHFQGVGEGKIVTQVVFKSLPKIFNT